MNLRLLTGLAAPLLLIACQSEDPVVVPEGKRPVDDPINFAAIKDAVYDPARINTTLAPPLFRDDTLPPVPESRTKLEAPAAKVATAPWIPLPGRANDVAVGWNMYMVEKGTLKLMMYDKASNAWTQIAGPDNKLLKRIAAAPVAGSSPGDEREYLVAITDDGATYARDVYGRWAYLWGGGNGIDISVSSYGDLHYLGTSHTLYRWHPGGSDWVAEGSHTGIRLSSLRDGTVMVKSLGDRLWLINGVTSRYMNAWDVNDVCGDDFPPYFDWAPHVYETTMMMSGGGRSHKMTEWTPSVVWTKLGADYNTANIACAGIPAVSPNYYTTRVIITNNDGVMYYQDIK